MRTSDIGKKSNAKRIAILSVTAILLVTGVCYFLWPRLDMNRSLLSSYLDSSQHESSILPELVLGSNNGSNPTVTATELAIPAWDVKFSVPVSLQDTQVKYTERKSNDQPPVTYYALTTSHIEALGEKCTTRPFGDEVILNRFSEKPIAVPDGELINSEPIGGYYYIFSSPVAYCSELDAKGNMRAPSQVEVEDRHSLNELIKTIQSY